MNVYHITYTPKLKTANLFFAGCNFRCPTCIRKKTMYDIHLGNEVETEIHFLSLNETLKTVYKLGAKKVIMLGGEPTIDPELPVLTEKLHNSSIFTILLTNGYEIDKRLFESLDEIVVSIKAYSAGLHKKYTGRPNEKVLENFRKISDAGILLKSESVYIPDLIGTEEIRKIAQFISIVDPKIPYHIDAYIPVNNMWRAPAPVEIKNAAKEAKKYLKNVTYLCGNEKMRYKVFNVIR